jgi:hypothetical protein
MASVAEPITTYFSCDFAKRRDGKWDGRGEEKREAGVRETGGDHRELLSALGSDNFSSEFGHPYHL